MFKIVPSILSFNNKLDLLIVYQKFTIFAISLRFMSTIKLSKKRNTKKFKDVKFKKKIALCLD